MGENTKIEWADHTASFWEGCQKVSPGCANCYAESFEKRVGNDVWGSHKPRKWTKGGPALIRKLNKKAAKAGRIDTVFVNDLGDFFEDFDGPIVNHAGCRMFRCTKCRQTLDGALPQVQGATMPYCVNCAILTKPLTLDDLRNEAAGLFDECQNLIFMLLTKRPENILPMWPAKNVPTETRPGAVEYRWTSLARRDNVWLGTSVENQEQADERLPELLKCRDLSPVLFVSAEPLLGPVDLDRSWKLFRADGHRLNRTQYAADCPTRGIDWVITGGESGHNARPCNVAWIRSIGRQCQAAGVTWFNKQLGAVVIDDRANGTIHSQIRDDECWPELAEQPDHTGRIKLRHKKGGDMAEWPEDLRVRQMPAVDRV